MVAASPVSHAGIQKGQYMAGQRQRQQASGSSSDGPCRRCSARGGGHRSAVPAITNGGVRHRHDGRFVPFGPSTLMIEPQLVVRRPETRRRHDEGHISRGRRLPPQGGRPAVRGLLRRDPRHDQLKTTPGGGAETKSTAFSIIPTVGVAHYFSKQFSIALDVGLQYQDGTTKVSAGSPIRTSSTIATVTRILVRGFIW